MKALEKLKVKRGVAKGQITIVTLMALFMTLIFYIVFMPVITPMIDDLVISMNADPNEYTGTVVMLLRLVPFVFLLVICLTAIQYAVPRREGHY